MLLGPCRVVFERLVIKIVMMNTKLLIIDDDIDMLESIEDLLSKSFNITKATSVKEAITILDLNTPDAILVDLIMPEQDAIHLCKYIRNNSVHSTIPILVLSGCVDSEKRTECFLWGADDFIEKPFMASELIARILSKTCWKREPKKSQENSEKHCGNLVLDHKRLSVVIDKKIIDLTSFEYKLLNYFIEHKEKVLSRQNIVQDVWGGDNVSERTVDVHIFSLRSKLAGFNHEIRTVHRSGYILRGRQFQSYSSFNR